MTATTTVADIRGALKAWLPTQTAIHALGVTKAFTAYPENPSRYPVLVVGRPGGGPEDGDYPIDAARFQIDCWGERRNEPQAFALAQAVVTALTAAPCGELLRSDTRLVGVYGISVPYLPDPADGQARYAVLGVLQAQAV